MLPRGVPTTVDQLLSAAAARDLAGATSDLAGIPDRVEATRSLRVAALEEMLVRLDADRSQIERRFALGGSLGRVVAIGPRLGDPHDGGRRVASLTFENGVTIIYKPRPVRLEQVWHVVVEWLNAWGKTPDLRAPAVFDRESYGWVEFVPPHPPADGVIPRFLERAGTLLALFDVLELRDAHAENVLTSGEHPVLVDAETLAHPRFASWIDAPSLIQTGFLPWTAHRAVPSAPSGLLGGLPTARLDPPQVAAAVTRGYEAAYRLLASDGRSLVAPGGPLADLRSEWARVIVRPSRDYVIAIAAFLKGEPAYDLPPVGDLTPGASATILAAERVAIARGDIPVFRVRIGDVSLVAEGREIPDTHPRSAWDRMVARLESLSADECQAMIDLLRSVILVACAAEAS